MNLQAQIDDVIIFVWKFLTNMNGLLLLFACRATNLFPTNDIILLSKFFKNALTFYFLTRSSISLSHKLMMCTGEGRG